MAGAYWYSNFVIFYLAFMNNKNRMRLFDISTILGAIWGIYLTLKIKNYVIIMIDLTFIILGIYSLFLVENFFKNYEYLKDLACFLFGNGFSNLFIMIIVFIKTLSAEDFRRALVAIYLEKNCLFILNVLELFDSKELYLFLAYFLLFFMLILVEKSRSKDWLILRVENAKSDIIPLYI